MTIAKDFPSTAGHLLAGFFLAGIFTATPPAQAQTILFAENFTNSTGAVQPVNPHLPGWNAYISRKAFNMAGKDQYNYNNDAPVPGSGSLQARAYGFTDGGAGGAGYQGGFLIQAVANANGGLGTPIIASVYTGLSIGIADYSNLSFTWQVNTSVAGPVTHILLQVDGDWYASSAFITPVTGGAVDLDNSSASRTFAFSPDATAWNTFTLNPGTATNTYEAGNGEMGIGAAASGNLTGTLTGIGFLTVFATNGPQTNVRYDQLQITGTAIPEPATFAAVVAGIILAAAMFRRRARVVHFP
ncbi:PEP-CTERM putative exosortase interaction domain-containing protein [Opitutaceae bacterium TAV1]|nr:PEP-CTERM putative exosortase interaction domain-containing protein [Opitutaceae bacterium TAV1]